ncbi:MAG: D-alanine--D-alanine ligase A, partial [Calothrix sp. SM1_5_4]|nr:D-alanine--D-alanine ligase A [Calothrix sp. SM1_5_4]
MSKKMRVGILFGGRSGEHEVSIASALSVFNALDKSRYDVTLIGIDKEGRWLLPDPASLLAFEKNPMQAKLVKTGESVCLVPYLAEKQLIAIDGPAPALEKLDVLLPILHGTFGEDGTLQGLLEMAQIPYVGSGVLGSAMGMDKEISSQLFIAAGIPVAPFITVRKHDYLSAPDKVENSVLNEFHFPFFVKPANAGSSVGVHKIKNREQLAPALKDAF